MSLVRANKVLMMAVFAGILALVGLTILLASTTWAQDAISHYIGTVMFGSMGTRTATTMAQGFESAYEWIGGLLMGTGLLGLLAVAWHYVNRT